MVRTGSQGDRVRGGIGRVQRANEHLVEGSVGSGIGMFGERERGAGQEAEEGGRRRRRALARSRLWCNECMGWIGWIGSGYRDK